MIMNPHPRDVDDAQARKIERKAEKIARCLGYLHAFQDNNGVNDPMVGTVSNSEEQDTISIGGSVSIGDSAAPTEDASHDVDMWHLRSLAIQPGGLLNSHGRKLGWIKLAGVDDLVFHGEHANQNEGEGGNCESISEAGEHTYEQIQKHLEQNMEPSKWHIQRERRRLRKKERGNDTSTCPSSALSPVSSKNDLSSIGSKSGSSTPLTANLNTSYAGTPKSVSFHGLEPNPACFSNKHRTVSSPISFTSCPSVETSPDSNTLDTPRGSHVQGTHPSHTTGTFLAPSPLSLSSPTALPQCQLSNKFQWDLTPKYSQYSQMYQRKHKLSKARAKKDRRPQERKLLVQIATSAFYLLQVQQEKFQYYSGMQDLIAVLLLHLESPSLTSLILKQIVKSHLNIFCSPANENNDDDESFESCTDGVPGDSLGWEKDVATSNINVQNLDCLSLSFFPLLQLLDTELHDSLLQVNKEGGIEDNIALIFGEVLHRWISSWFCCHDSLPLSVISRVVDFLLASHPSMPLYLSIAIICHPIHRDKFLSLLSGSSLNFGQQMLENLFLNLSEELSSWQSSPWSGSDACNDFNDGDTNDFGPENVTVSFDHSDDAELVMGFMEGAISAAVSFIKQIPPHQVYPLVEKYQNGILMPYVSLEESEKLASNWQWMRRPSAPTDYIMIQRLFAKEKVGVAKQLTFCRRDAEKHQISLDASGLTPSQLKFQSDTHSLRNLSAKALIVGFALCIGNQLLQSNQPMAKSVVQLLSEDNSMVSLGVAISMGLQSLLIPSNNSQPPQPMLFNTSIETALSSSFSLNNDSAAELGRSPLSNEVGAHALHRSLSATADEMGIASSGSDVELHDPPPTTPNGDDDILLEESNCASAFVEPDMDKAVIDEVPPITSEDRLGNVMASESSQVDDITWENMPYNNVDWRRHVHNDEEQHESESPSLMVAEETATHFPKQDDANSGISIIHKQEEYLAQSVENKEANDQVASKYEANGYTSRTSKKLGQGIRKRALQGLKNFKVGYIALVENDDFFL